MTLELHVRPCWRLDNAKDLESTKGLWRQMDVLSPAEIERRAGQLCALAYRGDTLIGVATAYLEQWEALRVRLAFFRCLVVPSERRQEPAERLAWLARHQLEQWSRENPLEKVMGMAAIIPRHSYPDERREPVWAEGGLNLNLVGYTPSGEQLRVAWFSHARVE